MNLSKKQQEIVNTNEPYVVVSACAAAGKTACIVERARIMLSRGIEPEKMVVITFTNAAADEMSKRIGSINGLFVGTIHAYAYHLLCAGGHHDRASKYVDEEKFDMLFQLIKEHEECIKPVDYLIVDEAQDCSKNEWDFFDIIQPKQFFYCGDLRQCQPAGTKILLRGGKEKNIEDIQIGDDLVWYNAEAGHCSSLTANGNAIHKKVLKKSGRFFIGDELITIEDEENHITKYTPNHLTYINFKPSTEYQHIVYLMSRNNRFRVGKILIRGISPITSWRARMNAEKADKIWILKVFKTDLEARREEEKISYKYQIPQTCWQIDKLSFSQEDIDYIYEDLNTEASAKKCLKDYHRDINYPLIDKNIEWMVNQKFASNATTTIYAANIIKEVMNCVVYDSNNGSRKKRFVNIKNIKYDWINEPIKVYSIETESGNYVADGILTHNCIYEWRDASPEIFYSIIRRADVKTFSLDENYRNGKEILDYAKWIISRTKNKMSDNSYPMRGVYGNVEHLEFDLSMIPKIIQKSNNLNWFVLTRTNEQVENIQYILDRLKIPNITFKRGGKSMDELNELLNTQAVKVLTIHSAKGLECENVIVVGANMWKDEEIRLSYVAATRARDNLYWMSTKRKKW